MAKQPVTYQVDDEVLAVGKTLIGLAKDIQSKASLSQDFSDVIGNLSGGLMDLANLSADLKANADNRSYLGGALEQVADAFLYVPAAAPAVVAPVTA